ncbi:MAG: DUF4956 domain-containing protein [Oscillospiraceae bacterium]|nr:DUF4956 domain-containing protein [Oscillospiraceae bacterium]
MSELFNSIIGDTIGIGSYLLCLLGSVICGVLTAAAASYKTNATKSFLVSLILLPAIVETVITMVNGNVGTGVAVMGAFSLVRFRSVPGKARDIVSIFLAMTAGLACAAGYVALAVLFTILVCAIMIILAHISIGDDKLMELRITVPESLNFYGEFDDIFAQYTKKHRLVKTKTSNMGSLYKLTYTIEMKDKNEAKDFIDKLRCRNGNLEISLSEALEGSEAL